MTTSTYLDDQRDRAMLRRLDADLRARLDAQDSRTTPEIDDAELDEAMTRLRVEQAYAEWNGRLADVGNWRRARKLAHGDG